MGAERIWQNRICHGRKGDGTTAYTQDGQANEWQPPCQGSKASNFLQRNEDAVLY